MFIQSTLCTSQQGGGGKARSRAARGKMGERDPLLLASAYAKHRMYLFTPREPEDTEDAATGRCHKLSFGFASEVVIFLLILGMKSCAENTEDAASGRRAVSQYKCTVYTLGLYEGVQACSTVCDVEVCWCPH